MKQREKPVFAGVVASGILALLTCTVPANATSFRHPLNNCNGGCALVSAYFDLDTGGGLRDWNCGANTYNGHRGTDIAIVGRFTAQDAGREVVAAADGTVIAAHDGEFDRCTTGTCGGGGGFGNYVSVRHADGKVTYYAHMRTGSVRVSVGNTVRCGQVIGLVGSSGNSTGPHLHFEVRPGGGAADCPFAAASGCGGAESFWVSQGGYNGLPGTACEGGAPPPPPPPMEPPCTNRTAPLGWNCSGPIDGMHCIAINEPSEAATSTWGDNYFCSEGDLGFRWSSSGPIAGMRCTQITEGAEPASTGWNDNYLCVPEDSEFFLQWSSAGAVAGMSCVQWREAADPHTWNDNFLCWTRRAPRNDAVLVSEEPAMPPARVRVGQSFSWRWRLRNTGELSWGGSRSYQLVRLDGESFGASTPLAIPLDPRVSPGEILDLSLSLQAPNTVGSYEARWRLAPSGGSPFGPTLTLRAEVTVASTASDAAVGTAPIDASTRVDGGAVSMDASRDGGRRGGGVDGGCGCHTPTQGKHSGAMGLLAVIFLVKRRRSLHRR